MYVNNVRDLYKNESYSEICDMWDEYCVDAEADRLDEWEYMYFLNSLYRLERYSDCLEVYKRANKFYPESKLYSDKMGWSVYHLYLKEADLKESEEIFFKQAEYVMKKCDASSNYSPIPLVLQCVLKAIKRKDNVDYKKMNRFLDYVTPEQLSNEEKSFKTDEGIIRRTASPRESWYTNKTKALLKLKKYDDCISCCDRALGAINRFHNNGDHWILERKIDSLIALQRINEAGEEIMKLLNTGSVRHWGIYDKVFYVASVQADDNKALKYLALCALTDKSHEKRVRVYKRAADYLYKRGMEEAAMLHRQLTDILRKENDWKTIEWEWPTLTMNDGFEKNVLLTRLRVFWQSWRDTGREYYDGKIERIFNNGKSGFICNEQGNTYYFSFRDIENGRKYVQEGSLVRFTLEERENHKTNRKELNAINISVK